MKIVCEIGCNHQGSLKTAEEMIQIAAIYCKVDVIKFQKRTIKMMPKEQKERLYDNPNSFGQTYGEHRKFLEFTINEHALLKEICEVYGKTYSCSVWDIQAAKEIISLKPDMIKIPSAKNTDWDLIRYVKKNYDGEIHISFGMTTQQEKEKIKEHMGQGWVAYMCTSTYPCDFDDMGLGDFKKFRAWLPDGVHPAYSGHHKGIAVDLIAYHLGATHLERHFTLDRAMKGTDHAASLEPEGMRRLARDISACDRAMVSKGFDLKPCETEARRKLK